MSGYSIKIFSCYSLIIFIVAHVLILSGCVAELKDSPTTRNEKKLETKKIQSGQSIPGMNMDVPVTKEEHYSFEYPYLYKYKPTQITPRVRRYNWNNTIEIMINKMLQIQNINPGSLLLINDIKNCTNGSLNTSEATDILHSALSSRDKFLIVSAQKISMAKQKLGLSSQDRLSTRNKALGISRIVSAQYILYSSVYGNIEKIELQMQLIQVHTGEIVWSEEDLIQTQ